MSTLPSRQKALFLESKFGGFAVGETDVGRPGLGQLLIKVEAAALNPIDWKIQACNALDLVETYPSVQGWDLSGTVVDIGEAVDAFEVGDRVQAHYDPTQRALHGTFLQYFVADARFVAKIPPTLAFDEAATLLAGLASAALPIYNQDGAASSARLTPPWLENSQQRYAGKPIFIAGGATSVGQYVIQLARLSGFSPIITTASLRNNELLRSLGATHVLDRTHSSDEVKVQATRITGGPFELIYDAVSLPETLSLTYALTAPHGDLVVVLPAKEIQEAAATDGDMKRVHVVFGVMCVPRNIDAATSLLGKLPELLESGQIKPNRVEVVPGGLDGIAGGPERLKNDQSRGEGAARLEAKLRGAFIHTRCSALVKPGRQSCSKHAPAYDASYERYKRAEEKAKDLRAAAQTKRGDVHTIPFEDIRPRIENVRAYIKGLESELWLRREHDVRFIGNPDEGHRKRLDALEKQLTHHRDIVEALRARLQRLKPESDSSPPKHRPRHRHTLSDPTPQPAPSVARSPRKRSRGRQKEQRGVHRRGRSEQSGSKKQDEDPFASTEHRKGVSKEGDGFDGVSVPSGPTLRESEGAWVGDRLERGSGVVSSGGDEGEQGADGDRRAESIVVGHRHGIIPSDDGATLHAIVEAVNMGSQPYLPTELDRATRMATNGADTALQPSEIDDTLVSTCAEPPSPLLQTVGEYTEACPESQETGSGGGEKPGTSHHGRFWKYALTAILPVTVIVLKCTLAVIRKRTSRL